MGFLVKGVKSVIKAVVGITSKVVGGVFGFITGGGSKKTKKATGGENLNKSLEPEAYRKIVFGLIAAPLDVRFWQVWGTGGTKFDEVLALASHRINNVLELYFEDKVGINASNAASGSYVGSVTRSFTLGTVGQAALSVGDGTQYGTGATFDGCAAMVLKWLPDEKKLPDGIPGRYTQIVEGALVYDPRRDGTQPGGVGTHRANDRSTWAYATLDPNGQPIGRNNALQALWYLLGWYIPIKDAAGLVTGEMLVCGRGVDPQDINMASFVAGANNCEVAAYYTDMVLSTEDDHVSNENKITCDGLIGRVIDPGGLWSYYANVDDTANIAVELTDKDILENGSISWDEFKGMSEQYNQVGGKFINPSNITLYQAFPYPMVRDATYEAALGVKRRKTRDFPQVLDNTLAQRLARLFLNEGQYQGEYSGNFMSRAIRAQAWSVVRYQSDRFGWTKLFRVWRHEISTEGGVGMLLKEIHASIWAAGTVTAPVAPGLAVPYNSLQEIAATGVTVTLVPMTGTNNTLADGFAITWAVPSVNVRRTEIRYRLVNTTTWETAGPVERDVTGVTIGPLFSGALYEAAVRHISVNEIAGPWVVPTTAPANASGQFALGTTGNVNRPAIEAAGGTALWTNIVGQVNAPTNLANRTQDHTANSFLGRGDLASLNGVTLGTTQTIGFGGFAGKNSISWEEDTLLTNRPLALTDLEPVTGSVPRIRAGRIGYHLGSAGYLSDRWPQEAGANVTENRTANTFTGRGDFASLSAISFEDTRITNKTRVSRINPASGYAASNFASDDGRSFSKITESSASRDGDVITFASTLPAVPKINFLPGGNAASSGQNIQITAVGLTVSGFTMKAKSQSVTAGATITDSTAVTPGTGEPSKIVDRSNSGAPFDGRFRFNLSVTVGNVAPGEPGSIDVAVYVKKSAAWVQVGSGSAQASGTLTIDTFPGVVDFGAGGEFGASAIFVDGTGTALNGISSVVYTLGTATETSLTPTGASDIPWLGLLQ